jgi:hypothetical protein
MHEICPEPSYMRRIDLATEKYFLHIPTLPCKYQSSKRIYFEFCTGEVKATARIGKI